MDAFVDTLVQLLIDWGYVGLFISALLAGSIIPFSSEIVMVALVKVGLSRHCAYSPPPWEIRWEA